jgi:3-deoxy-D-manno-octulosonic-acid transferase
VRVGALLTDAKERAEISGAARQTVERLGGALERTLTALDPYFMQIRLERRSSHA